MVYFRELPVKLNDIDDDFIELFFRFANTFTEESILNGYLKDEMEKEKEINVPTNLEPTRTEMSKFIFKNLSNFISIYK